MINETRITDQFLEMVKIPSPSLKEREVADYLIKELGSLGLEVTEDDAGEKRGGNAGNVIGVLKAPEKKKLIFSAHMDTVLPCKKITPIREGDIIKTDGTSVLGADDKAGIAAILEMIRHIKENNLDHPEIIVVFSMAEEIGLMGAQEFDIEKYSPDYGIIVDTGAKPGAVTIQAPSAAKGKIRIIGKPAHAGIAPENGINALTVMAHGITKMKMGRIDEETTSNIGVISGGQAVNIVMPDCRAIYECRSLSDEKLDNLLAETKELFQKTCDEFGAELEWDVKKNYAGFKLEKDIELLKKLEVAATKAGLEYKAEKSGGGSDTNIYNTKGVPSVNLGIGYSKVHTTEEFMELKHLYSCTNFLVEIIKEFA